MPRFPWSVLLVTAFRLFIEAVLRQNSAYNASWLSPLIGGAIALPLVVCADSMLRRAVPQSGSPSRAWSSVGAFCLTVDATGLLILFAATTHFTTPLHFSGILSAAFVLLTLLFVIHQPLQGVCAMGAAMRWMLALLLLILTLFRLPAARADRLFPILGGGVASLMHAGLSCAGAATNTTLIYLAASGEEGQRSLTSVWCASCAIASAFACMEVLIAPSAAYVSTGTNTAIGILLTSGRTSISLRMPLYITFFLLLFHSIAVELKCACVLLAKAMKARESLPIHIAAVALTGTIVLLSKAGVGELFNRYAFDSGLIRYGFLPIILVLLFGRRSRKGAVS